MGMSYELDAIAAALLLTLLAWFGLFALDQAAQMVRRLSLDGAALGSFKVDFRLSAQSIAADPQGNVYVADTGNQRVQKFDPGGGFLAP